MRPTRRPAPYQTAGNSSDHHRMYARKRWPEGGAVVPNYRNIAYLLIPPSVARRAVGGGPSCSTAGWEGVAYCSSSPRATPSRLRRLMRAGGVGWKAGAPKSSPHLWLYLYTAHSVIEGRFAPRVFALAPNKSPEMYNRMRTEFPNLIGEERRRGWKFAGVRACVNRRVPCGIPGVERCALYPRIRGALYQKAHDVDLSARYIAGGDFRLRVKKIDALWPPPIPPP